MCLSTQVTRLTFWHFLPQPFPGTGRWFSLCSKPYKVPSLTSSIELYNFAHGRNELCYFSAFQRSALGSIHSNPIFSSCEDVLFAAASSRHFLKYSQLNMLWSDYHHFRAGNGFSRSTHGSGKMSGDWGISNISNGPPKSTLGIEIS